MSNNRKINKKSGEELIRLPYFDWDKVKYFYYVAKLGSLSAAAEFFYTAQSAISRKMKALEDHLNCDLFIRHPRGVELTGKGQELFEIVERTFLDLKGFSHSTAIMVNSGKQRKIRISTTHPIAAYIINPYLIQYTQINPGIIFEVMAHDDIIDLIINDVEMAIKPFDLVTRGIIQELLLKLEKKLYTSQKYLDKYGIPKDVDDLKNHHIVAQTDPRKHPYSDIHWILRLGMNLGEMHTPIFTSNSLECLIEAVKEGIGIISCYEEMSIVKDNNLIQILKDIAAPPVEWYCAYPEALRKDNQFQDFKDYLIKCLSFHET